jgi:hypothetical protein
LEEARAEVEALRVQLNLVRAEKDDALRRAGSRDGTLSTAVAAPPTTASTQPRADATSAPAPAQGTLDDVSDGVMSSAEAARSLAEVRAAAAAASSYLTEVLHEAIDAVNDGRAANSTLRLENSKLNARLRDVEGEAAEAIEKADRLETLEAEARQSLRALGDQIAYETLCKEANAVAAAEAEAARSEALAEVAALRSQLSLAPMGGGGARGGSTTHTHTSRTTTTAPREIADEATPPPPRTPPSGFGTSYIDVSTAQAAWEAHAAGGGAEDAAARKAVLRDALLSIVQGSVLADLLEAAREAFVLWHWLSTQGAGVRERRVSFEPPSATARADLVRQHGY